MNLLDYLDRPPDPGDAAEPKIILRDVGYQVLAPDGTTYPILQGINLSVPSGRFVSIVGPSGCGKSTLLNLVSGLTQPTEGEIVVDGAPVRGPRPGLGYLFQRDALLPWKTVFDNVALGLRFHRLPKSEATARAQHWIERVGLRGFERHYPAQLSGGMRKRVGLAQVLTVRPSVILMDEPFAALDVQTRRMMEEDLLRICREGEESITVLFVTHDLDEAISLSDRVVVMGAGPASTIKASYAIGLGWPRRIAEVPTMPGYQDLYRSIWHELRKEVQPFYAGQSVHYYSI